MIASQVLAFVFVLIWIYASYRYDGFNVRGEKGDVALWDEMLSFGSYGAVLTWGGSILLAITGAGLRKIESKREKIFWLIFSVIAAPLLAFSLSSITP
jgi:hypothetical protein